MALPTVTPDGVEPFLTITASKRAGEIDIRYALEASSEDIHATFKELADFLSMLLRTRKNSETAN